MMKGGHIGNKIKDNNWDALELPYVLCDTRPKLRFPTCPVTKT